jgi:hypothetical protein
LFLFKNNEEEQLQRDENTEYSFIIMAERERERGVKRMKKKDESWVQLFNKIS